jgi:hypothetical protein
MSKSTFTSKANNAIDGVVLEILSNRLLSVAEEMGAVLIEPLTRRTSRSAATAQQRFSMLPGR